MTLFEAVEALDVTNCNLAGSRFSDVNLCGSGFTNINLGNSRFEDVSLEGTLIRNANLSHLQLENCAVDGMTCNGVLVTEMLKAWQKSRGQ